MRNDPEVERRCRQFCERAKIDPDAPVSYETSRIGRVYQLQLGKPEWTRFRSMIKARIDREEDCKRSIARFKEYRSEHPDEDMSTFIRMSKLEYDYLWPDDLR